MASTKSRAHEFARLSLGSVLFTSLTTTFHHYYRFGFGTLFLGVVTVGLPTACLWFYRKSRTAAALVAYTLVSAWIVVGFGIIDGMWRSTLKIFLGNFLLAKYGQYFSWDPIGSFPFEATGIVASVSSLAAGYYTIRFVHAAHVDMRRAGRVMPPWVVPTLAAVGLGIGTLVAVERMSHASPMKGVIKIGVIVPAQGPGALLGSSFLKAIRMAQADLGHTKNRYELVVEDTGTNPAQTTRTQLRP